jgi:hypothetical protein
MSMTMSNRRAFRPSLADPLEERVVMSQAAASLVTADTVHVLKHGPNPNLPVPFVGPVGTLGDSYTDEYRFYPPDRSVARNWVEMLHSLRGVSFGHFTTKSRGEPRDQGFAYNWARSDATSVDMIANQLPGLTQQVAAGQVKYAWIFIGGNDYLHLLDSIQAGKIAPADIPAAIQQTTAQLEVNFVTAVDTLLAANPNVKLVVSTLPAISNVPLARLAAMQSPQAAAVLQGVDLAVANYNALIRQTAATSSRIALVDLDAVVKQIGATATNGQIPFDHTIIDLTHPSDDYHSFFLGDYIHIGTVGQGIVADEFALAIDGKFGAQLFPPAPDEIVHYAAAIQHHATHAAKVG